MDRIHSFTSKLKKTMLLSKILLISIDVLSSYKWIWWRKSKSNVFYKYTDFETVDTFEYLKVHCIPSINILCINKNISNKV